MKADAHVLFVDGDAHQRRAAERALHNWCGLRTVASAHEAFDALRAAEARFTVVVTALTVPQLDGELMLSWLHELYPNVTRVLTVDHEGLRELAEAVDAGRPYRVVAKPFAGEDLRSVIADAHHECARHAAQRKVLEGTLNGSIEAIASVLAVVHPAAFGCAIRLRRMVTLLADRIGLPSRWELEVAALLSQVGVLGMSPDVVERLARNEPVTSGQREQMTSALEATLKVLAAIPHMHRVCQILRAIDLVPQGRRDALAVVGDAERVLTMALDFDRLYTRHSSAVEALRIMDSRSGVYHPPFLKALHELVGVRNSATLVDVMLAEVRLGQVFAAEVRSPSDLLLVARGQPVTPPLLLRIQSAWSGFASMTKVRVIVPNETASVAVPTSQAA